MATHTPAQARERVAKKAFMEKVSWEGGGKEDIPHVRRPHRQRKVVAHSDREWLRRSLQRRRRCDKKCNKHTERDCVFRTYYVGKNILLLLLSTTPGQSKLSYTLFTLSLYSGFFCSRHYIVKGGMWGGKKRTGSTYREKEERNKTKTFPFRPTPRR